MKPRWIRIAGVVGLVLCMFKNHIRINCGQSWTDTIDRALCTLGKLCERAVVGFQSVRRRIPATK